MGLTLIRKSDRAPRKRNPKIALVLAGGAVSGGAFKVGGLKALDDFLVGRKVTDLDIYVGLSAGAMLAVPLACRVTPDEMVAVLEGSSARFDQLRPFDFYRPNWREFASRPAGFFYELASFLPRVGLDLVRGMPGLPEAVGPALRDLARERRYVHFEQAVLDFLEHVAPKHDLPAPTEHIPSGFFDNSTLERWLRRNLDRNGMPNDFRELLRREGRRLYISACALDTAERVIFGPGEKADVAISEAVRASSALPLFYKPARIDGIDYVDGGVRNTANIDVAIQKGADLVICYNPFRPFLNRLEDDAEGEARYASGRPLADRGAKVVANQVLRTLLHSRLRVAVQHYLEDERFQGDIVLLEPREYDHGFFALNPLAFWRRWEAVEHGFESVRRTIEHNFDDLSEVLGRYGMRMDRRAAWKRAVEARAARRWRESLAHQREEQRIRKQAPIRLVGSEPA